MDIDVSRQNTFLTCPYLYQEKYERNLERKEFPEEEGYSSLDYGTRWHELMQEHYMGKEIGKLYPPSNKDPLEAEAQLALAAYKRQFPVENFNVIDVERIFKVRLPNSHHCVTGKIDLVVQPYEASDENTIWFDIYDHKTQARTSKSNLPKKWAARDQASIYLWAAMHIYEAPVHNFYVNVHTRQSPKGQIGPSFPERQKLERTVEQIETAIRDITHTADMIEMYRAKFGNEPWPAHREECYTWGECEFYLPHTYGWSDAILNERYQPRKEYLELGGVPIIQT